MVKPSLKKISLGRIQRMFMETFGLGRSAAFSVIILLSIAALFSAFWFFHSAPPSTLIITTGPPNSVFQMNAEKFQKILARNGVKLIMLPSHGSQENLKRLADPSVRVDIGFVQGGVVGQIKTDKLVSLGNVSYSPLLIFYRHNERLEILSQLKGKKLAIGPEGSGTRIISLALLAGNGIEPGKDTELPAMEPDDAAKALQDGKIDAVFLMGDAASVQIMRQLLRDPNIKLFTFTQADAYTRKINYLNKLDLPMGSIDFGQNIPDHDIKLIGPTVELIARNNLHPALSDLLIEAAHEIYGSPNVLRKRGEFPNPIEHEFRISEDALRYYKSGKTFLYRYLPFRIASFVNRMLVVFIPALLVILPGLRLIPSLLQWRIKLRIYKWYRALLSLEQQLVMGNLSAEDHDKLLLRLDEIDGEVNKMKIPASFADQFYVLRQHIIFVHDRLLTKHAHRRHPRTEGEQH